MRKGSPQILQEVRQMFRTKIMSYEIYKNGKLVTDGSFRYIFRKKHWVKAIFKIMENMDCDNCYITIKKPR